MTAEEFREWQLFFTIEQLAPAVEVRRHADVMAALHNGPLMRRGKKLWESALFIPRDHWRPPVDPNKPKVRNPGPSFEQLKAHAAAHNGRRRR